MRAQPFSQKPRFVFMKSVALVSLALMVMACGLFSKPIQEALVQRGTVSIVSEPEGAQIVFDGAFRGTTYTQRPLVLKGIPYGRHSVRAEFPLRVATVVEFDLGEPEKTVRVPIGKDTFGQLTIRVTPPGAEVFIDSRYYGRAEPELTVKDLAFGEHSVWLRKKGYQTERQNIFVERQAHRIYDILMEKQ